MPRPIVAVRFVLELLSRLELCLSCAFYTLLFSAHTSVAYYTLLHVSLSPITVARDALNPDRRPKRQAQQSAAPIYADTSARDEHAVGNGCT